MTARIWAILMILLLALAALLVSAFECASPLIAAHRHMLA